MNFRVIALFLTVVTVAIFLAACTPDTVSPPDLADAAHVYSNDCASCHREDRTGDHGKNITQPELSDFTEASLEAFLLDHKTAKNLTPEQVAIMANWLKTTS
ncbi:hypothetical protein DGWBC_0345 [Dehalogenimonas sp. WBC-2]|nr:hypothetical protein DGWBC_0345 [Dehalogenimonas sp. WBC-2]